MAQLQSFVSSHFAFIQTLMKTDADSVYQVFLFRLNVHHKANSVDLLHAIPSLVSTSHTLPSLNREIIAENGNKTTSVLNLVPSPDDDGSNLICKAENIRLKNSAIEDRVQLSVLCE